MTDPEAFLKDWFPELPAMVIGNVLLYVDTDIIAEVLLRAPKLRSVVRELYYQKEIHLILSPTKRPHHCVEDARKEKLVDIVALAEIEEFLLENPDISPDLFKVVTSGDFTSMKMLLERFHSRLGQVPKLEINIEYYKLTSEDVRLIFSFPNLTKVQISATDLTECRDTLAKELANHSKLREVVLLGHGLGDWSGITFNQALVALDLSWCVQMNVESVLLPPYLADLYWNMAGLQERHLQKLSFPLLLKTLMLCNNSLRSIDVSQLPQTLETIDLSQNLIREFRCQPERRFWPPNLKSILLSNNDVNNHALQQLSTIAWPPFLENLYLNVNLFTSFEHLQGIPDSIKTLDLSYTKLRSFSVKRAEDEYNFRFPTSLRSLNMHGCTVLSYGHTDENGHLKEFSLESRISFPTNLEKLNLSDCAIFALCHFLFPPLLKTLDLSGNFIFHLTNYSLLGPDDQVLVEWSQMTNIRHLDLSYNQIDTLEDWVPPPSLRTLDLSYNVFHELVSHELPIFDKTFHEYTDNLTELNFAENAIDALDPNLWLPQNLQKLDLASNAFREFLFTEEIAAHKALTSLDLHDNVIEKISLQNPKKKYALSLKLLNLSKNGHERLKMTSDDFYKVLEQLGLTPVKRKGNLKSEHRFK